MALIKPNRHERPCQYESRTREHLTNCKARKSYFNGNRSSGIIPAKGMLALLLTSYLSLSHSQTISPSPIPTIGNATSSPTTTIQPTNSQLPTVTEPTTPPPTTSSPTTQEPSVTPTTTIQPTSSQLPTIQPTSSQLPTINEPTTSRLTTSSPTIKEPRSQRPTITPTTSEPTVTPTTQEPIGSHEPSVSPYPSISPTHDDWSFIVMADWHRAESFIYHELDSPQGRDRLDVLEYMKENFGGDFVLLPGDSNSGKWDVDSFLKKFQPTGKRLSAKNAILKAGKLCYGRMKEAFSRAGYDKILMAVGDHELGGNNWRLKGSTKRKANMQTWYRKTFVDGFNREAAEPDTTTGVFRFNEPIGDAPARPYGTIFQNTSFAHVHKNMLIVTIDNFRKFSYDYMDRENGLGGEGTVTCTVEGPHLNWFRSVLEEARKTSSIKHIIVQSHVPVIQPVRKVSSSGQFMDYGEESEFWKTMREFDVDMYFAGEVHTTTVTKDPESNLLQVVSRGNNFNSFLKVDATDDILRITSYVETGPLSVYNKKYEIDGLLTVDKRDKGETVINATGVLKLLNRDKPVVRFKFDELLPLGERKVTALKHDDQRKTSKVEKITIRGVECRHAVANTGSFDAQYDAQVGNIKLVQGIYTPGAAEFTSESRVAIFGTGPHSSGDPLSYALWFRTTKGNIRGREMVLIHYGSVWYSEEDKNIFTVTLRNGTPVVYTNPGILTTAKEKLGLNDGRWHHLAVTMPKRSCLTSEIQIYVDGKQKKTKLKNIPSKDEHIFFLTGGRVSLGGLGYSWPGYEDMFPFAPFEGNIDEFFMWSRSIVPQDLKFAMKKKFKREENKYCNKDKMSTKPRRLYGVTRTECVARCANRNYCWGYEIFEPPSGDGNTVCYHFSVRPEVERWSTVGATCGYVM